MPDARKALLAAVEKMREALFQYRTIMRGWTLPEVYRMSEAAELDFPALFDAALQEAREQQRRDDCGAVNGVASQFSAGEQEDAACVVGLCAAAILRGTDGDEATEAAIDAAIREAREGQKRVDAEIVDNERDAIDSCCNAVLIHVRDAILRGDAAGSVVKRNAERFGLPDKPTERGQEDLERELNAGDAASLLRGLAAKAGVTPGELARRMDEWEPAREIAAKLRGTEPK